VPVQRTGIGFTTPAPMPSPWDELEGSLTREQWAVLLFLCRIAAPETLVRPDQYGTVETAAERIEVISERSSDA
jgi:hypothetical protein